MHEEQQARFRRADPIAASLFGDLSDRALRILLHIFGVGFVVVGVLGVFT